MSVSVDRLYRQVQQLLHKEDRSDFGFTQPIALLVTRICSHDVAYAMEHRLEGVMWRALKDMIDKARQTGGRAGVDNAMCAAEYWLTQVALAVQREHEVEMPGETPAGLVLSPCLRSSPARPVPPSIAARFSCFVLLRMGDVYRYKRDVSMARHLYECAVAARPCEGDAWNQLGLLAAGSGEGAQESLACHTRALHCSDAFAAASANIENMLRKHLRDEETPSDTWSDAYMQLIARCHFLCPVSPELCDRVAAGCEEKGWEARWLAAPLALVFSLGDSTDECRSRAALTRTLHSVWERECERVEGEQRISPFSLELLRVLMAVPGVASARPSLARLLPSGHAPSDPAYWHEFTPLKTRLPADLLDSLQALNCS